MVLHLLPNYCPSRNRSMLHTLPMFRGAAPRDRNCTVLQGISLVATSSYSIRGGKGWPGSKGRLSVPLFLCPCSAGCFLTLTSLPLAVTLASARCHTAACHRPDTWHWFCCFMYLSQLFSLAVKFMEFRTLLNHYSVSFSWEEIYKEL